jgi:exodeoxyribonuclease V gamma subunit
LQGFSRKYTPENKRLYSYLDHGIVSVEPLVLPEKQAEDLRFEEIQLDDLVRFFNNPFKTYYNKVLGIYYDNDQSLLPDTELFNLDNLQQWSLKQILLQASFDALLEEQLAKTGQLPLKNMGSVVLKKIEKKVAPVRTLYKNYAGKEEEQTQHLEILIGDSLLTGTLRPVFNNNLLFVSWSTKEMRYLVETYIRSLAGTAAGLISGVSFLSGGKKLEIFKGVPVSTEEAKHRLAGLISIYKEGFTKMAPWYRGLQIIPEDVEELDMDSYLKMIDESLAHYKFPCTDPYVMAEYGKGYFNGEEKMEQFKTICQQIIVPLPQFFPDYNFSKNDENKV